MAMRKLPVDHRHRSRSCSSGPWGTLLTDLHAFMSFWDNADNPVTWKHAFAASEQLMAIHMTWAFGKVWLRGVFEVRSVR